MCSEYSYVSTSQTAVLPASQPKLGHFLILFKMLPDFPFNFFFYPTVEKCVLIFSYLEMFQSAFYDCFLIVDREHV